MTTNDAARPVEGRGTAHPETGFDELIAEEEAYTPPPARDGAGQDAVPVEVLPPAEQPGEQPAGHPAGQPDVPRDLDGEPTDFQPLWIPDVDAVPNPPRNPDPPRNPGSPTAGPPNAGAADGARWQEIQVRFVDDPAAAVGEAAELVEDAVARLRDAVEHGAGPDGSTEQFRLAFKRYRAIHDLATRPDLP